MKIYRVSFRNEFSEHTGYEYFSDKAAAKKVNTANKKYNTIDPEIAEYDFEISKKGFLKALNQLASHPDNG